MRIYKTGPSACRGTFGMQRYVNTRAKIICGRSLNQLNQFLASGTHSDARARLSKIWIPTGGTAISSREDSLAKLVRAGFLRQAYSGIYHILPLGQRVQRKLEELIDRHMSLLGASKLSLSTISSEELWVRSGRLEKARSELFYFEDRKSSKYLLSPTHEEEITSLVSSMVKSYKDLPIRLYQISRKYRDEPRPRHGLFRSREFLMKDLYTFDCSPSSALSTYHAVRAVYSGIFNELKIPFIEAKADSGDIGGSMSHEFHIPTSKGEDRLLTCTNCDYVANEELTETVVSEKPDINSNLSDSSHSNTNTQVWRGISKDRSTIFNIWYQEIGYSGSDPSLARINFHAIKTAFSDFDPSVDDASVFYSKTSSSTDHDCIRNSSVQIRRIINIFDIHVPVSTLELVKSRDPQIPLFPASLDNRKNEIEIEDLFEHPSSGRPFDLLHRQDGDTCPSCLNSSLKIHKAIEIGHTFFLGARYCEPLRASISVPLDIINREGMIPEQNSQDQPKSSRKVPMQMGCYGIGVSRLIGVIADVLADDKGLNWPRAMAPYEVVIIPSKGVDAGAEEVYDQLDARLELASGIDHAIDDRKLTFPWKMQDADLIGYSVIVVVGRRWKAERVCEVQCRQLKARSEVSIDDLRDHIISLLSQL